MSKDTRAREKLLEDLLDILVEYGIAGLTIRKLAEHSGVAIGTVQYYFPTKITMIQAASTYALTKARQAFATYASQNNISATEKIAAYAHMLVPQRHDDRTARVWLEVATLAAANSEVAREHAQFWQAIEDIMAATITAVPGWVTPENDVQSLAAQLIAFLDGLTIAVVTEPDRMPGERAHTMIDQWLQRTLPA